MVKTVRRLEQDRNCEISAFWIICLNVSSDVDEVTSDGKSFQIWAPATGKVWRPTAESLTVGTSRWSEVSKRGVSDGHELPKVLRSITMEIFAANIPGSDILWGTFWSICTTLGRYSSRPVESHSGARETLSRGPINPPPFCMSWDRDAEVIEREETWGGVSLHHLTSGPGKCRKLPKRGPG